MVALVSQEDQELMLPVDSERKLVNDNINFGSSFLESSPCTSLASVFLLRRLWSLSTMQVSSRDGYSTAQPVFSSITEQPHTPILVKVRIVGTQVFLIEPCSSRSPLSDPNMLQSCRFSMKTWISTVILSALLIQTEGGGDNT